MLAGDGSPLRIWSLLVVDGSVLYVLSRRTRYDLDAIPMSSVEYDDIDIDPATDLVLMTAEVSPAMLPPGGLFSM